MDTKQTINELYQNLYAKGIVSTRKEFYNDWTCHGLIPLL